MTIRRSDMKDYRRAKKSIEVSVGESVRIIRELQELSQNELAKLTGIPQSTISAIEIGRVHLGVERAKVLVMPRLRYPHPSRGILILRDDSAAPYQEPWLFQLRAEPGHSR